MTRFDDILQVIGEIQTARSTDEICTLLLNATRHHGLTALMAGTVPRPGTPKAQQKSHVMLSHWPQEWLDRYVARNYVEEDPVVSLIKRQPKVTRWSAAAGLGSQEVLDDAAAFDLKDGLAFPLVTVEGTIIMVSFGGEPLDLTPQAISEVELVATYAVGRAMQLLNALELYDSRPELTPRETECLKWAAEGKSEWEISQILGISEHTAEKHLLNAKRKLGAGNRVHAVAEAIRLGFIS